MITATWELVYSLIMRYTKGKEFMEGWFALFFRFMGILLPGMAAHSPVNYVNAIRLGPAVIYPDSDEHSDTNGIKTPLINNEEEGATEIVDHRDLNTRADRLSKKGLSEDFGVMHVAQYLDGIQVWVDSVPIP